MIKTLNLRPDLRHSEWTSLFCQVIAREEGRTAKVYTISLLLLTITWSPFYLAGMVQVQSGDLSLVLINKYTVL